MNTTDHDLGSTGDFPHFYRRSEAIAAAASARPTSTTSSHEPHDSDVVSKGSTAGLRGSCGTGAISPPATDYHHDSLQLGTSHPPPISCTCSTCPHHLNDPWRKDEYAPMPEETKLGYLSVSSLIINKMIGTGVFAKPTYVLQHAGGSKGVALLMWVGGGFMTLAGLLVYLEFGMLLPFNGAEIVYVDESYKRPRHFFTIVVSIMFLSLGHNAANCIGFAKLALLAVDPRNLEPDHRLQKFVAFVTLTLVCLIHVFSRKIGLWITNLLAVYKIALVSFICFAGFAAMGGARVKGSDGDERKIAGAAPADQGKYGLENFGGAWDVGRPGSEGGLLNYANAMLGVLYSYHGWENGNYVLSEVKRPPGNESKVFKWAALGSFASVTVLYTLANVAYMTVLTSDEIIAPGEITASKFFTKMFGTLSTRCLNTLISLSILGNILSFTYGHARVKREIAKLGILPFSAYWARESPYRTPVGALTLHWIFASLLIFAVPPDKGATVGAYDLTSNLFIYAQTVLVIVVSIGLLMLRYNIAIPAPKVTPGFLPRVVKWRILLTLIGGYVSLNLLILLLNWYPPPESLMTGPIPWYTTPTVATSVIAFGVTYWFFWAKLGELRLVNWWRVERVVVHRLDGERDVRLNRHMTGWARTVELWWRKKVLRKPVRNAEDEGVAMVINGVEGRGR